LARSALVGLQRRAGWPTKDQGCRPGRTGIAQHGRRGLATPPFAPHSSRYGRPVASASFRMSESRLQRCMVPSFRRGQVRCHRCRRALKDRVVDFGRSWVLASWSGDIVLRQRQVLRTILLKGGIGRQEAVGLQPEELRSGWPDPTGRRPEASLAKHRGDGRCRDVDAELQ
jgi:hypothetical protein